MKKCNIFHTLVCNSEYRSYILSLISLIITGVFLIYNFYIGLKYQLIWNVSIAFYYLILLIIRMVLLINESKWKTLADDIRNAKRVNLLKVVNVLFIMIDLTLFVPISLMVLGRKIVTIGSIPAIATAAFTTYKIITSIIGFQKTKVSSNIILHVLKTINLKEAIVSVITLQNTMIMAFSNGASMLELTSHTSAVLLLFLIGISVYQIVKERKFKKINN